MREPNEIEKLLAPMLEATPFQLVWVEVSKGGNRTVVRVFIDKQGGISSDEIASASRKIDTYLDVEMPNLGNYVLEVSSPGLDRPLMRPEHFAPQIGEKIALHMVVPVNGRRNFKGILRAVLEDSIEMIVEDNVLTFTFDDIDKARVVPNIRIGSKDVRRNHEH